MKRAYVFAFSQTGIQTAERIVKAMESEYECLIYTPEKFVQKENTEILALPGSIGAFTGTVFQKADALVYVGACGIAVRAIAPYIKSKTTDPAVLCVDERATFCIALLSGHIGGGNRLTNELACAIGAIAVVTTATDINKKFSVDTWATENGYVISSLGAAKDISAAILEREIPIWADKQMKGKLPAGLCYGDAGELGIAVSIYDKEPFGRTLRLIPKVLTLGIGCRRGISAEAIETAVSCVFAEKKLDLRAVERVTSIDLKVDEAGLLEFCEKKNLPVTFYTAEQLSSVPGEFSPSGFVKSVTGVDNVCERSAAAEGGRILVKKTALNGVTVAVSQKEWEVNFGSETLCDRNRAGSL